MSEPTPLEELHTEYAQLQLQPPAALTAETRRSLTYYLTELATGDPASRGVVLDEAGAWVRDVFALEEFVGREGRMPRENRRLPPGEISTEEKTLAGFVWSQRRSFAAGRLCSYQMRRLLCIPAFSFHPLEDLWDAHLEAYLRFTNTRRDAPKLRSDDPLERRLACLLYTSDAADE